MTLYQGIVTTLTLLMTGFVSAQSSVPSTTSEWEWGLTGQLRPRFSSNYTDGQQAGTSASQRAMLGVHLDHTASRVGLDIAFWDVRVWGEELDTLESKSANGFDLSVAQLELPLGKQSLVRLGRQQIGLDRERLLGPNDWLQRSRVFDGVHVARVGGDLQADLFYFIVREGDAVDPDGSFPAGRDDDAALGGARIRVAALENGGVSVAYYGARDLERAIARHTTGVQLDGHFLEEGWSYVAEAYYQSGELDHAPVSAYLLGLRIEHASPGPGVGSRGSIFMDYLSGDGSPEGAFDTLFGSDHPYYGTMDLFATLPDDTANRGLIDMGTGIGVGEGKSWSLMTEVHFLSVAEATAEGESHLGTEIDVVGEIALNTVSTIELLYGYFAPDAAFRVATGLPADARLSDEQRGALTVNVAF